MTGDDESVPSALLITGPVGSGKTSVAQAIGDHLVAQRIAHAVIDLDQLRHSWPPPPSDRFNLELELRNLQAVASNYRQAGAGRLVLAGVVERRSDVARYSQAVGSTIVVFRLLASLPTLQNRLRGRHGSINALAWHLDRARELVDVLDRAHVEDFAVETDDTSLPEVARIVARRLGW